MARMQPTSTPGTAPNTATAAPQPTPTSVTAVQPAAAQPAPQAMPPIPTQPPLPNAGVNAVNAVRNGAIVGIHAVQNAAIAGGKAANSHIARNARKYAWAIIAAAGLGSALYIGTKSYEKYGEPSKTPSAPTTPLKPVAPKANAPQEKAVELPRELRVGVIIEPRNTGMPPLPPRCTITGVNGEETEGISAPVSMEDKSLFNITFKWKGRSYRAEHIALPSQVSQAVLTFRYDN